MATRAPKPPANWTPANSIDTSTCKSIQCSVTYQWHHNKAKQTITNKPPLAYTVLNCAIYALRHLHLHLPQIQRNISCCLLKSSYHLQSSMSDIKGSQVPCLIHNSLKKKHRFKAPGIHEKFGGSVSPTFCLGIQTTPAPWKTAGPEALGMIGPLIWRGWQSGNHIYIYIYVVGTGILFASTLDKRSFTMQVLNWQAKKGLRGTCYPPTPDVPMHFAVWDSEKWIRNAIFKSI